MEVSEDWLQGYVNACYAAVPQQVQVQPKTQGQLTVQMDELWSFVDDKGNKQWVWLAQDVTTREIVGCYIGDRSLGCCKGIMGLAAACVPTMCRHLYRLLAGL
jgi:insertion element IS1 protein InsB